MSDARIIWQYWETRGVKPAFVDSLHAIATRNAGVEIRLVTPETLASWLPDLEPDILRIETMAHKADMIRTRLLGRYGGMWLDSDAVVLGDLNWMFDHLSHREFVGFNDGRRLAGGEPWVRVSCFLSRPEGTVIREWERRQSERLPQIAFRWSEIGAEMLNPICIAHSADVTILPLDRINPVSYENVHRLFESDDALAERILRDCSMVMVSNQSAKDRDLPTVHQTIEEIAAGDTVLARVLRQAMSGPSSHPPPHFVPGFEAGIDALSSDVVTVQTVYGPMIAFRDDFITAQIGKFGAHTRTEIAFLLSVLKPGDLVFDLGAHIGTYAIPMAQAIGPEGRLLAVEAASAHVRLLRRNLKMAGLEDRTVLMRAAIGQPGATYAAHPDKGNTGGTSFTQSQDGEDLVRAVSLDNLARRHFTPRVIKLDIEGGEFAALAACALLARERPILYCEVNGKLLQKQGASIGEMGALLRRHGYRFFRNVGERHAAHDNFTVAALAELPTNLNNFDVLAVHESDDRLPSLIRAAEGSTA